MNATAHDVIVPLACLKPNKVRAKRAPSEQVSSGLGRGDRSVADDDVALEQAGGLAWGGAVDRVGELELEPAVRAGLEVAGDAAGDRA